MLLDFKRGIDHFQKLDANQGLALASVLSLIPTRASQSTRF